MTTQYATIQVETRTVYGIGDTEARAQADAAQNGMECACDSRDEDCTHAHGQLLDGFATVPCTEAAAAYVQQHGGAPTSDLTVSARGVMLRSEER